MESTLYQKRIEARNQVKGWAVDQLIAKGFEVTDKYGTIIVSLDGIELGKLDFYDVSIRSDGGLFGTVRYAAGLWDARPGRYEVSTTGTVNILTLARRLKDEHAKWRVIKAARAEERRRQQADDATLASLGVIPKGVRVNVYNGKVDIHLVDITPEKAGQVLKGF